MKKNITIITITIVLALGLLNFLSSRHFLRWDVTRNQDYTLAPATKQMLRDLKDVVTFRMYFTKDLPPQLSAFDRLVKDSIDEFRSYGGQNIRVEVVDPAATEDGERGAALAGITPVQLNVQGQGKLEVAKVYIGMALLHGDKKEVIPVIAYPQNLEYDLTSRILKLTRDKLPVVAWWGPGKETGYQAFRKQLEERYTVMDVNPQLPNLEMQNPAALILISPKNATADQQRAVENYLQQGGKLVALMDTAEISPSMQATPQMSGFDSVFSKYGISIDNNLVMDRANAPAVFSGGVVSYQIPYPFWVKLLPKNLDAENRMVSGLDAIILPWASSITVTPPAVALARTTTFAKVQNFSDGYKLDPETAGSAMQADGGKVYDMIALADGEKGAQVLVMGTSRVIQDIFMQQFPQDATLVANAVDIMALGDQLIGIRTRSQLAHPLTEMTPLAENIVQYANVAGGVILIVAMAMGVFSVRRSRRKALQLAYTRI